MRQRKLIHTTLLAICLFWGFNLSAQNTYLRTFEDASGSTIPGNGAILPTGGLVIPYSANGSGFLITNPDGSTSVSQQLANTNFYFESATIVGANKISACGGFINPTSFEDEAAFLPSGSTRDSQELCQVRRGCREHGSKGKGMH